MADVRPLRGIRFDTSLSGPVGSLIAPPYDVASEPANGAEFSIRKIESVDLGGGGNDHAWAAERFGRWQEWGILRRDAAPTVYVHHHQFNQHGVMNLRTGLLARVRLADWTERIVLPHERTTAGPREERLYRLRAVQANLSPLYFLYRDPDGEIRDLIAKFADSWGGNGDRDQMGGAHSLTAVADVDFHARLSAAFAQRTLFVADGHHRYEAALSYRNECREVLGADPEAPWEFVLTLLAAVEDPGVSVRPTHRLLAGHLDITAASILDVLQRWFDVRRASGSSPLPTHHFVCRVALSGDHGVWDVHARPGNPHHALLPRDRGAAWRSLGVSAVEGIVESLLGTDARITTRHVLAVIDDVDAMERVKDGRAQAAFLLPAPNLDRLLAVAEQGDLLPAKSTWFEPKAPAGLVINDLRR